MGLCVKAERYDTDMLKDQGRCLSKLRTKHIWPGVHHKSLDYKDI